MTIGVDVIRISGRDRERTEACARMMADSEPWITLQRSFESALQALQDPEKELYAVLTGDEIAGFVLLDMRGLVAGYIQTICVKPAQRGRGLGTALIEFAEQRIFRDSPNVFICVSSFNPDAQRLYERLGYQFVGRLASFIVSGHDEILLRKTIGTWAGFRSAPAP